MSQTEEEPLDQSGDVEVESVDVEQASQDAQKTVPVSNACGSPPSPEMRSQTEEDTTTSTMKNHVQELRHHIHSLRRCAGVSMVMQDLQPDLRVFLQNGHDWVSDKRSRDSINNTKLNITE